MFLASASLATSDIPWNGPIGKHEDFWNSNECFVLLAAVRIGSIDGQLIANPSRQQMQKSDLNLVVSVNQKGQLGKLLFLLFFNLSRDMF